MGGGEVVLRVRLMDMVLVSQYAHTYLIQLITVFDILYIAVPKYRMCIYVPTS